MESSTFSRLLEGFFADIKDLIFKEGTFYFETLAEDPGSPGPLTNVSIFL